VILLKADLLARAVPEEAARRHVESIQRAGHRMESLIKTLLDAQRIESGNLTLTPAPTDPAALLSDAAELLEGLATEKSIRLVVDPWASVPAVQADRERVLQALENLIGNAIKFSPPGSVVRLGAAPDEAGVRIEVADSGPGIEPSDAPHLFDRYFQGERKRRKGLGLGLYIARGIVEAHGGRIWVESAAGAGATFRFTLPAAKAEATGSGDAAARSSELV
jgi:signal transduction histidine kinase